MRQCDQDLFLVLEAGAGSRRASAWPDYSGPADPWTEFHMPCDIVASEQERSAMIRRACSWMLWRLPDDVVVRVAGVLVESWHKVYRASVTDNNLNYPSLTPSALASRDSEQDDELVIYKEKVDRKRVEWIRRLRRPT